MPVQEHEITDDHYETAKQNGIDKKNVYNRVIGHDWTIERAITQRLRTDLIDTEKEFFSNRDKTIQQKEGDR